jgi:chitodextrinase
LVSASETLVPTISPVSATNQNVVWKSTDPSIATVSASGLVTGIKKGTATITATSVNGLFSASASVTITRLNTPPVAVLKYSPGNNGYTPYKVTFDGRSSYDNDPGDFVLGFDWVIKLKGTSTIIKTEVSNGFDYTFTTPGVYEVTFQAVDNDEKARSLNTESVTITVADMPSVPVAETALCYEGFDYLKMAITDLNGGRGWNGGWQVQDPVGNDATGFAVDNATPITVANLRQTGNYMKLGHGSEQCGRALDVSSNGAFKNYITTPTSGVIGKTGTTLWFSTIIRPQNNNKTCNVSFNNSGVSWYGENSTKKVAFGAFGGSYWGLAFGFETTQVQHLSTLPIVNNVPVFLVAKLDFGATNIVTLYLNPAPGNAPTGTPVIATTTMNLDFRNLGTTYTYDGDKMGLDEIRFGANYADVAPAFVADTEKPSAPTNVIASNVLSSSATISWTTATDNIAVEGYEVFDGTVSKGTTTTNSKVVVGLAPLTGYNLTVKAFDAAGNFSLASSPVSLTTGNPDTTLPSNPSNLAASSITTSSAVLTWTSSTDNELVAGYEVYKDGNLVTTASSNTYTATGLQLGTSYNFSVKAKDAAGNLSSGSASVTFSTLSVVDGITARGENLPNEGLNKLTDGNLSSKWLDFSATSWVKFAYSQAKTWNGYEITSGDDSPERDAKNWTLQGSIDGTTWTVLNTQNNQTWTSRKQTRSFTFTNTTAYNYYKWDITANGSGTIIQACEFKFLSLATGIGDVNSNLSLIMYPNPVLNQLHLNFESTIENANVKILDLQGRTLMTKLFFNNSHENIDVSSLSNGVYLLKVVVGGSVMTRKFIKK